MLLKGLSQNKIKTVVINFDLNHIECNNVFMTLEVEQNNY